MQEHPCMSCVGLIFFLMQSRDQAQLALTLTKNIRQYTRATTVNKIQTGILMQWRRETNETVTSAIIRVSKGNPQSRPEGPEDTS